MNHPHSSSVIFVDNTDPDNLACVLAAANPASRQQLLTVIVTGRAANFNRNATIDDVNERDTQFVLRLNTVRMKNFLSLAGYSDIPVFMGNPAPRTIVPHRVHLDERMFGDVTDDQLKAIDYFTAPTKLNLAGNLDAAAGYLLAQKEKFHVIVGGPMTDVAMIVRTYPNLVSKISSLHAQFGMFDFGEKKLMDFGETPRGKRQFNVACDPEAAHNVLMNFPGSMYLYPSDVTRVNTIGFPTPDALAVYLQDSIASRELVRIYRVAYEHMIKPRGESIYVHDLAPLFGYLNLVPYAQDEIDDRGACIATDWAYRTKAVEVIRVPHLPEEREQWGEISIRDPIVGSRMSVAIAVSKEWYLREMSRLLC